MAKIAIMSNVNTDPVVRLVAKEADVFEPQGYGGELGMLLDPFSALYAFRPEIVFLLEDLAEILAGVWAPGETIKTPGGSILSAENVRLAQLKAAVNGWFTQFESALRPEIIYYLSDAYMHTPLAVVSADPFIVSRTETVWNKRLVQCLSSHANVRVFPYRRVIEQIGREAALSASMWYLGKIPHSIKAQQALAAEVLHKTMIETRTAKKVLALDLDNTLWGGLAGERDHAEVVLSDEHTGLAYKNLQRVIHQMKEQGVLLCIVSKNNPDDALDVIRNHPHMILREADFAAMRINWKAKHENLRSLAQELNLGLDSFVFFDDSAQERALIKDLLPEVTVPDFPAKPEGLLHAMEEIYRAYFEKGSLTEEDKNKTAQYAAEHARTDLAAKSADLDGYLQNLEIRVKRLKPEKHVDRLAQLFGKTNQFNLTTRRLTRAQIEALIADELTHVFCYHVADRFGDLGLVVIAVMRLPGGADLPDTWKAAAIDRTAAGSAVRESDLPVITDLIMSCRVMGRRIEHAVTEDLEDYAQSLGYASLRAVYLPTAKNKPASTLWPDLGYRLETRFSGADHARGISPGDMQGGGSSAGIYRIEIANRPARNYILTFDKRFL